MAARLPSHTALDALPGCWDLWAGSGGRVVCDPGTRSELQLGSERHSEVWPGRCEHPLPSINFLLWVPVPGAHPRSP